MTGHTAAVTGRRITIHDVAREAGVSVATVSKVINGRDGIAAATSERVMKVVDDLGYASSLVATSMRKGRTQVIGVLLADFEPFALQVMRGISEALHDTEYDILAYAGSISPGDHIGWERRSLSRLAGTLIDGAIIITPTVTLPQSSVPVVALDPHTGVNTTATIDTDNFGGAKVATEHLLSLGHTKIAHLRGRSDLESAQQREAGYREALSNAGLSVHEEYVRDGGYHAFESREATQELLALAERPTAIFAANDLSALASLEVAQQAGVRVPEELSIIGFDDIPEAANASPAITTIHQPLVEMGASAVHSLLAMLRGEDGESVRMPTSLVIRSSTARIS